MLNIITATEMFNVVRSNRNRLIEKKWIKSELWARSNRGNLRSNRGRREDLLKEVVEEGVED